MLALALVGPAQGAHAQLARPTQAHLWVHWPGIGSERGEALRRALALELTLPADVLRVAPAPHGRTPRVRAQHVLRQVIASQARGMIWVDRGRLGPTVWAVRAGGGWSKAPLPRDLRHMDVRAFAGIAASLFQEAALPPTHHPAQRLPPWPQTGTAGTPDRRRNARPAPPRSREPVYRRAPGIRHLPRKHAPRDRVACRHANRAVPCLPLWH
jgi:hypothetical protein